MFNNLSSALKDFTGKVKEKVTEKEITKSELEDVLWELEVLLLKNNVAQKVIEKLKEDLKQDLVGEQVKRTQFRDYIETSLRDSIEQVMTVEPIDISQVIEQNSPALFLFMGFNGSGKTTTIAKMTKNLQDEDYKTVLAAGDTFRAASIEQLEEHADKLDTKLIKHDYESDAAAVVYDAQEHADNIGADVVLADTAGRSHVDKNLMNELNKIKRVNDPDLCFLVVEAIAGNDVVNQAEKYEKIGFDALIVTKADIDDKGGSILSLGYMTGKPVMYLGTGQGYQDLERFEPEDYVDQLFS